MDRSAATPAIVLLEKEAGQVERLCKAGRKRHPVDGTPTAAAASARPVPWQNHPLCYKDESMTRSTVTHTALDDSAAAGRYLGSRIAAAFGDTPPDVVILFASSRYDYSQLLGAIDSTCHPKNLVGCSSAGEFTSDASASGSACAIAIQSQEMEFGVSVARGLRADVQGAAKTLAVNLRGFKRHDYRYHSALILTDALAGHVEQFVEQLTVHTAGTYQFFGGGAGDDAKFQRTHVFCGTEAVSDAAAALEILSKKPIGIGVAHGWAQAGPPMRVTEASGNDLVSLNAVPASEAFQEHAEVTQQPFDRAESLPFFLHNVLGMETASGDKLRVPLGVKPDGSVALAAEIPVGSTTRIMCTQNASAAAAASEACRRALEQLKGERPAVAIFFDCAATRLRMGRDFGLELQALGTTLGTEFAGCNTYGQIARAEGQFNGFHNCTAVVCILPD